MADKKTKKADDDSLEGSSSIIEPNKPDVQSNNREIVSDESSLSGNGTSPSEPEPAPKGHSFSSTFGQIHVNDQLTVAGNTTLQGTLTVQKGLTVSGSSSFGSLSASTINTSNLQINGDFIVNRHIGVSGGTPGRSGGTALGGGGTASVSGSDTSGTVTVNTGGSPPAGCFITINFTQKFGTTPHVVISPSNSSAGTLQYYANRSATNFSICTDNSPAASTTYLFDYIVID
jgi:cytoskeletal protein CcmA (bactofilin family)